MVNKTLFRQTPGFARNPATDTVNAAGGRAYSFTNEHALCQYVVTSTMNGVYYASAGEQLEAIKKLTDTVHPELIAKAAVYGHENGRMKDVPAYLLAVLFARGENELVALIFNRVITNLKMLCNFVQIVRSGETGRKSFGTFGKALIQNWLTSRSAEDLFRMSIGHANPSLADIVKMVHPRPVNKAQEAFFAYLIGRDYTARNLPKVVKDFEAFKLDNTNEVPDVPFRALTNCNLTTQHWSDMAVKMPWNTLRMNINTLARNGVFKDASLTRELSAKLSDRNAVQKANAFPYQLLTTFQNTQDAPREISLALQDAMEHATQNVPSLDGRVAVCVDLSGSMSSPITGNRGSVTTKTSCIDVATLMAACFARTNPTCDLIGWASRVGRINVNTRDSIMTNAQLFAGAAYQFGGGTEAQLALQMFNREDAHYDVVIYISDNQSWIDSKSSYGRGTALLEQWKLFKKRNPKAKLICVDIQPYGDSQVPDSGDVMNIGGWSDDAWAVIHEFVKSGSTSFVDVVKSIKL